MGNSSFIELRKRLAVALDLKTQTAPTADIEYYVDPAGNPMGLVRDWRPDAPDKIIQVIEQYGLRVERVVKPNLIKPVTSENVEWVFHVWSRHPMYRALSPDIYSTRRAHEGPRVAGETLSLAVLTWAVLRAEHIKNLKEDSVLGHSYDFELLQERVYVSATGR